MAAADYNAVVQQLYISYFGRPADYYGLQNFTAQLQAIGAPTTFAGVQAALQADKAGTTALAKLVNGFNGSAESVALYGTDTTQIGISKFVAAIYQNVLGREADTAGFNFWVSAITSGTLTKSNAAAAITAAALVNTTTQGQIDAKTVANKLAVATSFTTNLDLPSEINAYAGDAAAATARSLLVNVNSTTDVTAYQTTINSTIDYLVGNANPGQIFTLTSSIDNFVGGAGNDTFIINTTPTSNPIGSLDVIDGGAGRDTLQIADTSGNLSLTGLKMSNIEVLTASTTGSFNLDISSTGVSNATLVAAGTTGTNNVTAGAAANVTLTGAGTSNNTVTGGKAVVINGAGTNTVAGDALSAVTINGGTASVSNTVSGAGTAGTSLTAVTLNGVTGATVAGNGITTLNLSKVGSSSTGVAVNVNNATAKHSLTVNADAAYAVVTDAAATTLAINATSASKLALSAAAATTTTLTGAGAISLDLTNAAALTTLDASAATGGVSLFGTGANLLSIKGGAGADSFTTTQTGVLSVDMGAGNDIVTLGSTIAAGSSIALGAGNDKLLVGAGGSIAANTTSATTVIDGGDGIDTLAAGLINAGNAAQFKNFEVLGLDNSTLDVSLATSNAFTGLELLSSGGTYTNITSAQALAVNTSVAAGVTTLTFNNVTGTADAYTITFGGTGSTTTTAAGINAGTVSIAGIETVNIVSKAASGLAANSITLADTSATTVTVTGDQALALNFATGFGSATGRGVSSIDASGATAGLTLNTTGLTAASAGLTIKGSALADSITLGGAATVTAGAGNDTITVGGSFATTLTGGAGNDTFNVGAAVSTAAGSGVVVTTITDFTAGDSLQFSGAKDVFAATATNVSTATTLQGALDLAAAGGSGNITWFSYGGNTYVVEDNSGNATFGAGDIVVKLTGTIDLSHVTSSTGGIVTL